MPLTTTQITGRLALPDDVDPTETLVRFTLIGFDTETPSNTVVIPEPIDATVNATGDIDVSLWANTAGERSTLYGVTVILKDEVSTKDRFVSLGKIQIPATGGPFNLDDLLAVEPPSGVSVDEYIAQLATAVANAEAGAVGAYGAVRPEDYGAVGDETTDDTTAIDDAYAVSTTIFASAGKVYRYVGTPPDDLILAGPGELVFEEPGQNPQYWGKLYAVGSDRTRGGMQRATWAGGILFGRLTSAIRGVIANVQSASAYLFFREQSPEGQSLLVTFIPSPRFEKVEGLQGGNTMTPRDAGTFNLNFFQVGRRVMVNGQLCRISAASVSSCTVTDDDGGAIAWATDWSDTAIIPQFVWPCTANVTNTAVQITSSVPEDLSVITDEVMLKIGGTYYQVTSAADAYNLVIDTDLGSLTDESIEVVWQREDVLQITGKWVGGDEEQTSKIRHMADRLRFDVVSSGQWFQDGVEAHRGLALAINNQDIMRVDDDRVEVFGDLRVNGVVRPSQGRIWTSGAGSPEGVQSAQVGSMWTRTDGGAGTTLYIKESGSGNTGWVAK